MPESKPLKTVVAHFRLTPEEKERWEAYCAEHDVTLSQAVRGGLKLYEQEMREAAARAKRRGRLSL